MDLLLRRENLIILPAQLAEVLDTDGLIAYWNSNDDPVNGNWVDRINQINMVLQGTTQKVQDGYLLDNSPAPKTAWTYVSSSYNTFLNNEIKKEFTCIIDCYIKFKEGKSALLIDFGSFTSSTNGISFMHGVGQTNSVSGNFKCNGNSSTDYSVKSGIVYGDTPYPIGQYVPIIAKMGVHLLLDGKQEVYVQVGQVKAYAIKNTPVNVNFKVTLGAFGLGVVYLAAGMAKLYGPNYLGDVIYKSIKLYNKDK